jgi:NAD(P)-dependent dehydrogenase (short-subunit alcohol dehydrogenase family)
MLSDKVCIVAGGGHGLGEATAIALSELGATVVVNDLGTDLGGEGESSEPADETVAEIRDRGGEAMSHFGDIASLEYTEQLVADAVDEYGRVDAAVNFAGVLADGMSYKMSADEWDRVIRVHLRGHFALLRNLGSHWRERAREHDDGLPEQRSFVSISSLSATRGNLGQANYCAAKAGILGLTRSVARDLNRYNVRVNAIMPNAFTRMAKDVPEEHRVDEDEIPAPEDNAPIIAYLMSDHAEDVTGCTFAIDGPDGDELSLVSEGEKVRTGIRDGGWSTDALVDRFPDVFEDGDELHKADPSPY